MCLQARRAGGHWTWAFWQPDALQTSALFNTKKTREEDANMALTHQDFKLTDEQLVWCLKSKHQIMVLAARATDAKMVSALLCHTNGLGSSL